jgi:AcrR family transcriptional regulator
MAPEERRAAIIAATIPLLREHGMGVSTRQIAEAAGVAEGTIFGVFPDKASLLRAALISAVDPGEALDALAAIGTGTELRARLRAAVAILRARMRDNLGLILPHVGLPGPRPDPEFAARMMENRKRIISGVAALVEPDRHRLRRSPEATAHLLIMLITVSVRSDFTPSGDLPETPDDEIVTVLLDGLLVPPAPPPPTGSPA